MKNIGIVIVFSAIGLLINTNIVTAQNGNKADAVYEMQKIILSDEADDLNGTDEQKYSDGSDYNGNYLEGKREGQGIYTFDNGDYYDGQWKNDLMSGEGVYYFSDGATLSGVFKKGKLKDGTFCYTDENGEYKVKIKNYKYSKKITATFLNNCASHSRYFQ